MPIAARLSREEYLALPESPPGVRFELLDGELVTMNDPLLDHQDAAGIVWAALRAWCRAAADRGRATLSIDTEVGPDTFFGPDVQWFAPDRDLPSKRERPWPVGDIVVEVASRSTARYDAETKTGRYLRAGAREVWLVRTDPLGARIHRRAVDGTTVAEGPAAEGVIGTVAPSDDISTVTIDLTADDVLTSPLLPGFALALADLDG
ncbi:MAG: Uma2 family endonuclease [Solirubrobacteraceae bacterium]|nr:Uma2 family endonuclease [Solirubrobacteraceae bacterium]